LKDHNRGHVLSSDRLTAKVRVVSFDRKMRRHEVYLDALARWGFLPTSIFNVTDINDSATIVGSLFCVHRSMGVRIGHRDPLGRKTGCCDPRAEASETKTPINPLPLFYVPQGSGSDTLQGYFAVRK